MPRGNDADAAAHELADKFGTGGGNAEELIDAVQRNRSPLLERVEMLPIDHEATNQLYEAGLDKLKGPDGEPVISARVRGGTTVIVYEDERGAYKKTVLDSHGKEQTELPNKGRTPEQKAKLTAPTPEEK